MHLPNFFQYFYQFIQFKSSDKIYLLQVKQTKILHKQHPRMLSTQSNKRSLSIPSTQQPSAYDLHSNIQVLQDESKSKNRSLKIDYKNYNRNTTQQKRDRIVIGLNEANTNHNWEGSQERQINGMAKQIRRVSTQFDENIHKQSQKMTQTSHNKAEYSPQVLKDQSQLMTSRYTPTTTNQTFASPTNTTKFQIQQLIKKINTLQNQNTNFKTQNSVLQKTISSHKQSFQKQEERKLIKISQLQKKLQIKNKQHIDKCSDNKKYVSKINQLQNTIRKLQYDKDKLQKQLKWQKQNITNLTKQITENKNIMTKTQNEKKKMMIEIEEQKNKNKNLQKNKLMLQFQIQKLSKIKQLVKHTDKKQSDQTQNIKKDIIYQVQLIEINNQMSSNLEQHKHDLKITTEQYQCINNEIDSITQQIAVKIKDVLNQKTRLEEELTQARNQTEKIRKTMFENYQQIISKLKDQIIQLKQDNINLNNHSQLKIEILKLQRQVKIHQKKVQDLLLRNQQLQYYLDKSRQKQNNISFPSESSLKALDYYDKTNPNNLQSIIMTYESRSMDLNSRIKLKQQHEKQLKTKLEQLQQQIKELKSQSHFSTKKQKMDHENIKTQLESMKMELKSETESLNRKIQSLEKNIQRKNKQIKEKDNFITQYLIQRVKGETDVNQIKQEIDKYFQENQHNNLQ